MSSSNFLTNLFSSPKPSPKEQMREWTNNLKKEKRHLEREIMKIEREQLKIKGEIKKECKLNHMKATKILGKSYLSSKKSIEKLLMASTQLNSVILQLKTQSATMNVVGAIEKSTDIMTSMGKLMRIPQIRTVASAMAKEMARAGIVEELMEDAFAVMEDDGLEEEAEEEVDKAIQEIISGQLSGAGKLKVREAAAEKAVEEENNEEDEKQIDEMKLRLQQLG